MSTTVAASTIRISVFSHAKDNLVQAKELRLAEFIHLITTDPEVVDVPAAASAEEIRAIKESGEMWSPCVFKGQKRSKDVEQFSCLPLDFDTGSDGLKGLTQSDEDKLFGWLDARKFLYAGHTSFASGYCAPRRKLRVVLFFDRPITTIEQYKKFWKSFTADMPVRPDSARNDNGCFFSPRCPRQHRDLYESFTDTDGTELVKTGGSFGLDLNSAGAPVYSALALTAEDWAQQLRTTPNQAWELVQKASFSLALGAARPDKDRKQFLADTWKMCREALEQNPVPTHKWDQKYKTCKEGVEDGWDKGLEEFAKRQAEVEGFVPTEKQLHRATQALKNAAKLVDADTKQLANQAYIVGRYTPHVLSADHVIDVLVKTARHTTKCQYIPEGDGTMIAQGGVTNGQKHPHFVAPKDAWRGKLIIDFETGSRVSCDANAKVVLQEHPDARHKLRWNVRDDAAVLVDSPPWESHHEKFPVAINTPDGYDAARWLASEKVLGGRPLAARTVFETMLAVAQQDKFDPFSDWLLGLKWDGTPRLDTWLSTYGGAEDSRYVRLAAKNFLIGCVALTLDPENSAVDTVLVLVGKENRGKSRLFKALAGEYFSDSLRDITDKDSYLMMQRLVILEIAELDKLMQYDDADVKSFITARKVMIRPAYERVAMPVVRRAGLCATTNEPEFLKSTTGNRRFLPVSCGDTCDYEGLEKVREQMWAEALHRYQNNEKWWLEEEQDFLEATEVQEAARVKDEVEFELGFLEGVRPSGAVSYGTPQGLTEQKQMEVWDEQFDDQKKFLWVTVRQVCDYLKKDCNDLRIQRRVGKALRLAGWDKTQTLWLSTGHKARIFRK